MFSVSYAATPPVVPCNQPLWTYRDTDFFPFIKNIV